MIRYLVYFLPFFIGLQLIAQNATPLWVPFNDHGKWGYCDTLGALQLEPEFESAGFFYPMTIGTEKYFVSKVETSYGRNLVKPDGELVLPPKLDLVKNVYSGSMPNQLFLVKKKGRYGIYKHAEGWAVPAKYDTLLTGFSFSSIYLLKRKGEETYWRFLPDSQLLEPTDIVDMGIFYHKYNVVEVITKKDGSYYELQGDELVLIEENLFSEYEDAGDMMLEEVPEDWSNSYNWVGLKPTAEELGVDRTLVFKDYSTIGVGNKYGFEKIIIAEKEGQMGVLNGKGEEILPFHYDKLSMDVTNTQIVIEKNGKFGRKILFTHYPVIEPLYDTLNLGYQLRVSPTWSFGVFEIMLDGQRGYVGENAVKYFDFE